MIGPTNKPSNKWDLRLRCVNGQIDQFYQGRLEVLRNDDTSAPCILWVFYSPMRIEVNECSPQKCKYILHGWAIPNLTRTTY